MSLKYVALLAVVGAAVWGVAGHETSAQDCEGRTVPVTVCNPTQLCPELAPSRMVATTASAVQDGPIQIPMALDPAKVFVLTSWSVVPRVSCSHVLVHLMEGPDAFPPVSVIRDGILVCVDQGVGVVSQLRHVLPTGVVFPRDPNGNANMYAYVQGMGIQPVHISVQGYIADDI